MELKRLYKYSKRQRCEKSMRLPVNKQRSKARMDATSVLALSAPVYIIYVLLKFATMAHTHSLTHSDWHAWLQAEVRWYELTVWAFLLWFTLVFMPLTNCNSCPRCFEKAMFITENDDNWLIYTSAKYHGEHLNNRAVVQTTATW